MSNEKKIADLALKLAGLCDKKIKIEKNINLIKSQLEGLKNGDISVASKREKYENEIISIIEDFGGKATLGKIRSKYKGKNCAIYLSKMAEEGKVSRVSHGVYGVKNIPLTSNPVQGVENNFNID